MGSPEAEGSVLDIGARRSAIKGPFGKVIRTPSRLLEAITDAAQVFNYSSELHAQGWRQAMREGLDGKEAWARATEIAANPTAELRQAAYDYGLKQTFQQPLGTVGQAAQALRDVTPGGRWLVPFFRTPLNILKSAGEFSPAGFIGTVAKAARGELAGGALSDALARNTVGTALAAAIVYHALEGRITGSGPSNPQDRLRLEAQGWQPYSLRVGDRYVSYRRLEPVGTAMSLAADVAEAARAGAAAPAAEGLTKELPKRVSQNIEHAPFIGGLMRLNEMLENPAKYARGLAGSAIPTGIADVAKIVDPVVRNPQSVLETLQSRIPGLSQNVPALTAPAGPPGSRVSATVPGPEITRPASTAGGFNPFAVTQAQPGLDTLQAVLAARRAVRRLKISR